MHSTRKAEYILENLQALIAIAEKEAALAFTVYCMEMAEHDLTELIAGRSGTENSHPVSRAV